MRTEARAPAWPDLGIAAAAGAAAFVARWSQRGRELFSWDSGLLAAGIEDYDFAAGHPHPPYYPLAIAAGKVLATWMRPVDALVFLAVLSSAVMVGLVYLVGRRLVGRGASLLAAALVFLSPTALFNGVAPLTYALEGATSAMVALAALECRRRPDKVSAAVLAVALSVAIGVRPSSLFLLAPLALYAVWGRWRLLVAAGVAGAGATIAWLVPALVAGGGVDWFLRGNSYQSRNVVFAHTVFQDGWSVVPTNAAQLVSYVPWEAPFAAALAFAIASLAFVWWPRRTPGALPFLATWVLPSVLFFLLLYAGWPVFPSGYAMVLVPAVAVLLAAGLGWAAKAVWRSDGTAPLLRVGTTLFLLLPLVLPLQWPADWDEALAGQREADAWAPLLESIRDSYPPNETALVTYYGWFWVRDALPDYLTWGVQPYHDDMGTIHVQVIEGQGEREGPPFYANLLDGPTDPLHPIPENIRFVVQVYAPPSRGEVDSLRPDSAVDRTTLPNGLRVDVVEVGEAPTIEQMLRWFGEAGQPVPRTP